MMNAAKLGALPAGFRFSQASLRDFLECPRRFELKYIEQCAWPALISEPALEGERRMLLGVAFHRLVQQHLAGLDPVLIETMLQQTFHSDGEEELLAWWQSFLAARPADLPGRRFVEYALVSTLAGQRIIAKLDLLVIQQVGVGNMENRATILDWKTSRPVKRERLAGSLQTRVYRCLAARSTACLNGGSPILPENIEMIYWFSQAGSTPVRFSYNSELYQEDQDFLGGMMAEIACIPAGSFDQTADSKPCERCVYRSLCGRGIRAGMFEDSEDDWQAEVDLNFDAIEEIPF